MESVFSAVKGGTPDSSNCLTTKDVFEEFLKFLKQQLSEILLKKM